MHKNSSTSNFKPALTLAVLILLVFECALCVFYHKASGFYGGVSTTWRHIKQIKTVGYGIHAKTVILGDSTAGTLDEKLLKDHDTANLALKIWDGMPGQYFMLKYLLAAGARPETCVLLSDYRLWGIDMSAPGDLEKANDSLFRPLASIENVIDLLFGARRPDLASQMIKEGLLPSRRFKIPLANLFDALGLYKLELHAENPLAVMLGTENAISDPVFDAVPGLSRYYFKRIQALCAKHKIRLIVLETSMNERIIRGNAVYWKQVKLVKEYLQEENAVFQFGAFVYPDADFDEDGVHLENPAARRDFTLKVMEAVHE